MSEVRFPMKLVTQRTGLSAHVVRVWERRYEAITPDRSGSNRRLYNEEEVRRLELMAILTRNGHSISQIARLGREELEEMAAALSNLIVTEAAPGMEVFSGGDQAVHRAFMMRAMAAVASLETTELKLVLEEAAVKVGGSAMIEKLIVPLIVEIGERWDSGDISIAQERAASTVIQEVLMVAGREHSETRGAPHLLVATPVGQIHELGSALVVCVARRRGWAVTYLGASIPAVELAHAATTLGSTAVALSLVYPVDDPGMAEELKLLRQLLPERCLILAGGRAAFGYMKTLDEIGALQIGSLESLKGWLDGERELIAQRAI